MNNQKATKINQLLQKWPKGTVVTTRWLRSVGIPLNLVTAYVISGWIDRIGTGAAMRCGDTVAWPGAVHALQKQLGLSVHPGAKTALGLQGALHYVPMGREQVVLYCRRAEHLPKWFTKRQWSAVIDVVRTELFGGDLETGMTEIAMGDFSIRASSRERAMLEYLFTVHPEGVSDEPVRLMEGLATLRPEVVQHLLEACRSVKAKRLFMVLTELTDHPWAARLDTARIDLGKGKRLLARQGFLHPRYQITLPKSWRVEEQKP